MTEVFIAIGTNVGNRNYYIEQAIEKLRNILRSLRKSKIYETSPYGPIEQGKFLNMVVRGYTVLPPFELLKVLKFFERSIGRSPSKRWGPREIDLDIIFYGRCHFSHTELKIPHPDFKNRIFVLKPLNDLAPQLINPEDGRTVKEIMEELEASF